MKGRSRARRPRKGWTKTPSVQSLDNLDSLSISSSRMSIDPRPGSQHVIIVQTAVEEKDIEIDYNKVDPPFLDEFDSSAEALVKEEEVEEELLEELKVRSESSSDEDKYAVYEKMEPLSSSTDMYDLICAGKTVESDDSFERQVFNINRRRRGKEKEVPLICESGRLPDRTDYLKGSISDALIQGLVEVAMYRPYDPVEYLGKYLIHSTKTPHELGLDPEPKVIEDLLDRMRVRRHSKRPPPEPKMYSEDQQEEEAEKGKEPPGTAEVSELGQMKRKYQSQKGELYYKTYEEKRRLRGRKNPNEDCLGPTSLQGGLLPRRQTRISN